MLSKKAKKKFYIATSVVYANAAPHLGFVLESVQADVLARYHRLLGEKVFFLTGVDEHGLKISRAAEQAGKTPGVFTEEISRKVRELKTVFQLSNDDFIRTTDEKRHWPAVRKLWLALEKRGDLYKKQYRGFYCSGCEAFVVPRDLIDEKCSIHQKEPEMLEEENYFFRLSKYSQKIAEIIKKEKIKIIPPNRRKEILNFVEKGLEDISFSRARANLEWGIPAPGDAEQTIYVWADALTNYLSALGYGGNESQLKKYWPPDVHCIGKDILKFHAALWPAMLLALKLALPKKIFVHGFIAVDGRKMSKSLGNIVDPFKLAADYGGEAVRYFLLRELPAAEDGDFSEEKFKRRYNADLANGLGNFASRVAALRPAAKTKMPPAGKKIKAKIREIRRRTFRKLNDFKFNESLSALWELIVFGDQYLNRNQPWKMADSKIKSQVISDLETILRSLSEIIEPFLPETGGKIRRLRKGEILFPRK